MNRLVCFVLLMATSTFSGCGGGGNSKKTPVYPVSGHVKMHGAPLPNATVAFAPETEGQPTAVGTTDEQGNFQLTTYEFGDGAAEGSYKVIVSKSAVSPSSGGSSGGGDGHSENPPPSTNSHSAAGGSKTGTATLVPAQYSTKDSTPFTAEVKSSGENTFEFEIK